MKKIVLFIATVSVAISLTGQEKRVKTGWKFGMALPTITYDYDLGFQYGALAEFFNYGDGSNYPEYLDHTYTEISRYTKGSGIYRFMFESKHIIPKVEWICDLSYLPDRAYQFYGYNGYESVYNEDWTDSDLPIPPYKSRMFYNIERNQFRFKNDFRGNIKGDNLMWAAGFAFQKFTVDTVNVPKLNKGKDDKLPYSSNIPGLYEYYKNLGIIPPDEASGGWVNTLKAGVTWDSRDNRPNPMKGLWTELGVEIAPKFMGNDWGFTRLYFIHRQYFTIIENDLSFAYRIGYQTKLSGSVPYFYESQVITSRLTGAFSEGLGGTSTLRGVLRNRVIGDGFVMGNFELRWKPVYFSVFKQDCYIGLNAFYDVGRVTRNIKMPADLETKFSALYPEQNFSDFFNPGGEKFHQTAGVSVMLVINQNFVIAIDAGKAFDKQDGNIGFSIGLNYLF